MSTLTAALMNTIALAGALDPIRVFIRRFVVLSHDQATTVALWIAHTHAIDAADCTPYLQIASATKRAGKTRLLEVLEPMVARPWFTGRTSAAALVRHVDGHRPTLLLDESDAAFGAEKEYAEALRGVLNTGYRRSGKATICVGQGSKITVRDFMTFGPKAIAGIGELPGTVADRAIPIALQRRKTDEPCERWREREGHQQATPLREALVAALAPFLSELREARPSLPDVLSDRQSDCWEPLLAIADAAGGDWAQQARKAAQALSGTLAEHDLTIDLLTDLRDVLEEDDDDVIESKAIISKLSALDDRPWAMWRGTHPISGKALARLLGPLGIHVDRYRKGDGKQVRGYRRDAFSPAFARYLPIKVSQRLNVNKDGPKTPISMCLDDVTQDTSKTQETPIDTGEKTLRHFEAGLRGSGDIRRRF